MKKKNQLNTIKSKAGFKWKKSNFSNTQSTEEKLINDEKNYLQKNQDY